MTNLAIIIPYYKLTFLRETLDSLAAQTDQRFKVYIGNDGSHENPEETLKEFEGRFNFTYKRFEENLGSISLTKHWDRCIEMIQDEEWFMILGDDDYLSENVVSDFYEHFFSIEEESNVVRYASRIIDANSQNISAIFLQPKLEEAITSYCRKIKGETRSSLSEYIFRKKSYERCGFKDYFLAWSSDDRVIIDISEFKPIYSLEALVYVRNSDINISGGNQNIQSKITARLLATKELMLDYKTKLTLDQHTILFGLYEQQFYLKLDPACEHYVFLFAESWKLKGFNYFLYQVKACLYKALNVNNKDSILR